MIEHNIITKTEKRSILGEIIVTLFEQCNMSCKFCNQDHNSKVGMDTIRDKLPVVKRAIENMSKTREMFSVHFMGGEVFSDLVPDSCFDDYKYLADELEVWSKENNYDVEICFTTNFVYEQTHRLQKLLDQCPQVKLLTSYDPSGRFGLGQLNLFKKNVIAFEKYIKSANVIMTKPNIDKFLKGDKKFLILSAPTGSGKSFFSKTISNLTNECTENFRELVDSYEIYKLDKHGEFLYKDNLDREKPFGAFALTITKPLQDQYKSFFDDAKVLKGKINHQCAIDETKDVEIAPCVIVEKIKKDCWGKCICPYYEDRNRLLTSQFGVLNYSMFLSLPEDLRKKEILICDEAGVRRRDRQKI